MSEVIPDDTTPLLPVYRQYSSSDSFEKPPVVKPTVRDDVQAILTLSLSVFVGVSAFVLMKVTDRCGQPPCTGIENCICRCLDEQRSSRVGEA